MSSATVSAPAPAATTPPPKGSDTDEPMYGGLSGLRRFTVSEYHAMLKGGVLACGERVELLDGYLVLKMGHSPQHDLAVKVLARWFTRRLGDDWSVGPQTATTLSDDSEPEPDLSVARGSDATFADRHPGPADLALMVEVSHTSLRRDRREKLAIYAAAGVPEYWVVNVPQQQVEVYSKPNRDFYDGLVVYGVGHDVPVTLDGQTIGAIPVADLFG